jgi:hypothetical protein
VGSRALCEDCPEGQYQDKYGATSCFPHTSCSKKNNFDTLNPGTTVADAECAFCSNPNACNYHKRQKIAINLLGGLEYILKDGEWHDSGGVTAWDYFKAKSPSTICNWLWPKSKPVKLEESGSDIKESHDYGVFNLTIYQCVSKEDNHKVCSIPKNTNICSCEVCLNNTENDGKGVLYNDDEDNDGVCNDMESDGCKNPVATNYNPDPTVDSNPAKCEYDCSGLNKCAPVKSLD